MTANTCPLCLSCSVDTFADLPPRQYFQCSACLLVFLDPGQRPSIAEERAEYDLHENDPYDPRYRKWLSKLTVPLMNGLPKGLNGLDFGSGPGPAISVMLAEQGYEVENYDPLFTPNNTVLNRCYDFITCTEVVEHFHHPAQEIALLARLLRPGGRLGIMTQILTPDIDFATWPYRLQPSHVAFYSSVTMEWIATQFHWSLRLQLPNVALFESQNSCCSS